MPPVENTLPVENKSAVAPRRGRPPQADLRDRILDATERLVARLGYSRMTMDDIAQGAGVGRATLYQLFSGKEAIALATADRRHHGLLAAVREAARTEGTASTVERLRRMMQTRILSTFDRLQREALPDYEMLAAIRADYMERRIVYMENEARLFAEVIAEGVQTGELVAMGDVHQTALALVQATNALMPFSLSVRQLQSGREEIARQIEIIAALLLDGLRARASGPEQSSP